MSEFEDIKNRDAVFRLPSIQEKCTNLPLDAAQSSLRTVARVGDHFYEMGQDRHQPRTRLQRELEIASVPRQSGFARNRE